MVNGITGYGAYGNGMVTGMVNGNWHSKWYGNCHGKCMVTSMLTGYGKRNDNWLW